MAAIHRVPQNSDLHQTFLVRRADLIEQLSSLQPLLTPPCRQHSNPPAFHNTEIIPGAALESCPGVMNGSAPTVGNKGKDEPQPFPERRAEGGRSPARDGEDPSTQSGGKREGAQLFPSPVLYHPETSLAWVMRGQIATE